MYVIIILPLSYHSEWFVTGTLTRPERNDAQMSRSVVRSVRDSHHDHDHLSSASQESASEESSHHRRSAGTTLTSGTRSVVSFTGVSEPVTDQAARKSSFHARRMSRRAVPDNTIHGFRNSGLSRKYRRRRERAFGDDATIVNDVKKTDLGRWKRDHRWTGLPARPMGWGEHEVTSGRQRRSLANMDKSSPGTNRRHSRTVTNTDPTADDAQQKKVEQSVTVADSKIKRAESATKRVVKNSPQNDGQSTDKMAAASVVNTKATGAANKENMLQVKQKKHRRTERISKNKRHLLAGRKTDRKRHVPGDMRRHHVHKRRSSRRHLGPSRRSLRTSKLKQSVKPAVNTTISHVGSPTSIDGTKGRQIKPNNAGNAVVGPTNTATDDVKVKQVVHQATKEGVRRKRQTVNCQGYRGSGCGQGKFTNRMTSYGAVMAVNKRAAGDLMETATAERD